MLRELPKGRLYIAIVIFLTCLCIITSLSSVLKGSICIHTHVHAYTQAHATPPHTHTRTHTHTYILSTLPMHINLHTFNVNIARNIYCHFIILAYATICKL